MFNRIFILIIFLFSTTCVYSTSFECPSEISTNQSLINKIKDWVPWIDVVNVKHRFLKISFYDGHPKELATLIPDNDDEFGKKVMIYFFNSGTTGKGVWLVCQYQNTKLTLMRKLPDAIKSCQESRNNHSVICR